MPTFMCTNQIRIFAFASQDELQTTTRSYEDQLSMMSEHLAGMNEKLTTQKDEIDMLKYQLQNPKVWWCVSYVLPVIWL